MSQADTCEKNSRVESLPPGSRVTSQVVGLIPQGAITPKELVLLPRKPASQRRELSKEKPWHTSTHTRILVGPRCSTWQTRQ